MIAPWNWAWPGSPMGEETGETLSLEGVAAEGLRRVAEAGRVRDEAAVGPVMHWAHILKTEQGPDGTWPAVVNARTGDTIGWARTTAPADLLARLDALINSSEYAACIALAALATREGDSNGSQRLDHTPDR
jgi:hypothetical protein